MLTNYRKNIIMENKKQYLQDLSAYPKDYKSLKCKMLSNVIHMISYELVKMRNDGGTIFMEITKLNERKLICKFLQKYFDLSSLSDDDNFIERGLVNSLFSMQLIVYIEKTFDLSVPTEDISTENFSSVNRIIDYIIKKKNN